MITLLRILGVCPANTYYDTQYNECNDCSSDSHSNEGEDVCTCIGIFETWNELVNECNCLPKYEKFLNICTYMEKIWCTKKQIGFNLSVNFCQDENIINN